MQSMHFMRPLGGLLVLILFCSAAQGETAVLPSRSKMDSVSEIHAFGGRPLTLSLTVATSSSFKVPMTAKLTQRASAMAAELPGAVPVKITENASVLRDAELTVDLPKVETETEMVLSFISEQKEAGFFHIQVYPDTLLESLQREDSIARVADPTGVLLSFLDANNIRYDDARDAASKLPVVLAVGGLQDVPDDVKRLTEGQTLILFKNEGIGVDERRLSPLAGGRLVEVAASLLDRLSSDPTAQKTFLELIRNAQPEF